MSTGARGVGDLSETLAILREGRARTRAELAAMTGESRSSIGARVDRLLASGLVKPIGEATSTGGRPPIMFAFDPAARIVVAIDLGATHLRVAVTDLASGVLAEHLEAISVAEGPEVVLERAAAVTTKLVESTERSLADLVGVGVGLPGPVDHSTGRPRNPPIMPGWDGADVPGILGGLLGGPTVLVDNDVNLMALGEHCAEYPDVDHLLFVKVATGIGSGVISDGRLRRGAQGAAGDMGHIAVPGGRDVPCRCGNTGCLEALASGQAIVAELAAAGVPVASVADVVAHVRAGDDHASRAVRESGRLLGRVIATCVSLLNPSVVVIGGEMSDAGEHLLAGIREEVYRRSLPLATEHLRIVTSRTTGRAGILGASTMVIEHALSTDALEDLLRT